MDEMVKKAEAEGSVVGRNLVIVAEWKRNERNDE
jgi:hypothetical protein